MKNFQKIDEAQISWVNSFARRENSFHFNLYLLDRILNSFKVKSQQTQIRICNHCHITVSLQGAAFIMCYIVLIRIKHDRFTATTYSTSWRERWRQRFVYKIMTFYHTSEKINNLYSDNSSADSSSYTESASEQENVVKMKDQAHS